MATHLDLEEQEQLDQLKAFWQVLIAVLAAFAAHNGWQWWQREQAAGAAAIHDELDRAAGNGDAATASRIFDDLKSRYPRTAFAEQGALLTAKALFDKGQAAPARDALVWVRDHARTPGYRTIARLRLAGMLLDEKKYDAALAELAAADDKAFEGLVADRRGDVLAAQGKGDEARLAYAAARKALDDKLDYRRLVDAKLTALGAAPEAPL